MYRVLQFNSHGRAELTPGDFKEAHAEKLQDNQIMVSDPDISYFSTILGGAEGEFYTTPIHIDDIIAGKASMETVKGSRHYFLLGGKYEVVARLSKAGKYFKLTGIMGTIDVCIKKLQFGEPFDDDTPATKNKK